MPIPFQSLSDFQALAEASDEQFEYTVAWIDCFSGANPRGILYRGNHAGGFRDARKKQLGASRALCRAGFFAASI